MNIWEWVHDAVRELRGNGQERLAELIDDVSTACCDGQHDRVENIVPEALALARAAKNPWIELFIRHWLLQSRVLHRHDVSRDTMKEAVSLIEFASRPETRDCPQGICAVQDLASAYGLVDGVGYAEERLAVTEEALGRIDASWPCFDCVSSERASALLDLRRHREALEFCDAQLAQSPRSDSGIMGNRFRALCALGRFADAERVAANIDIENAGESGAVRKALYEALALAKLGQAGAARDKLPALSRLEPEHFVDFLRCVRALGVGDDRPNTWRIERAVADMSRVLQRYESYFTLTRVHKIAVELAFQRGARASAERHIAAARKAAEHLRDPRWVETSLAPLADRLRALPAPTVPNDADELFAALGEDPERDLALLECAGLSEVRFERARSRALDALGMSREALDVLVAAFERWPDDSRLLLHLLELLREQGEHARLESLCEEATGPARTASRIILARSRVARGEPELARRACLEALELDPTQDEARSLLATLLRDAGEFEPALEHMNELVQRHEPGDLDWDRMLIATLAGRWDTVRDSAKRLGLPVEDAESGPIDDVWGPCRIRFRLADGSERAYFAWRTGPVTARVDEVIHPALEQHHGDVVVFDATP
ncbi:MAG TPA: hypothetical protein VFQ35_16160, partial [Polyangiaceae bacterium]|nr:hypothetical protein [Polyangiaceae bacterium]